MVPLHTCEKAIAAELVAGSQVVLVQRRRRGFAAGAAVVNDTCRAALRGGKLKHGHQLRREQEVRQVVGLHLYLVAICGHLVSLLHHACKRARRVSPANDVVLTPLPTRLGGQRSVPCLCTSCCQSLSVRAGHRIIVWRSGARRVGRTCLRC